MEFDDLFICTTDTVCGLGGPVNKETLKKIYFLKNRNLEKKIMIVVANLKQAKSFENWNSAADKIALKYWPGAVSIVVGNQGFRMPKCPLLQKFLEEHGPMYLTSANLSGQKPLTLLEASKQFPQIKKIYYFCRPSNKPSDIYIVEDDIWIRR